MRGQPRDSLNVLGLRYGAPLKTRFSHVYQKNKITLHTTQLILGLLGKQLVFFFLPFIRISMFPKKVKREKNEA